MSETVYIETSIIGYLTARPSNNLILMANLESTRQWWGTRRDQFTLYLVLMPDTSYRPFARPTS